MLYYHFCLQDLDKILASEKSITKNLHSNCAYICVLPTYPWPKYHLLTYIQCSQCTRGLGFKGLFCRWITVCFKWLYFVQKHRARRHVKNTERTVSHYILQVCNKSFAPGVLSVCIWTLKDKVLLFRGLTQAPWASVELPDIFCRWFSPCFFLWRCFYQMDVHSHFLLGHFLSSKVKAEKIHVENRLVLA